MRQMNLPVSVYVFRFIWSQSVVFAHNFAIFIAIMLVFLINPGLNVLLFIPALLLIVLNGAFCAFILGPLCARFRDIPMIVGSVMQIAFFMTPIIWSPDQLSDRLWLVELNPFYHFIEIAKDPMLGSAAAPSHWLVCLGVTVVLGAIATCFFARVRSRLPYWS